MKKVVILGSTGSIGQQAIEVVKKNPDKFKIVGLAARRNITFLEEQIRETQPEVVALTDSEAADELWSKIRDTDIEILAGYDSLPEIASWPTADTVLNGLVGAVGLEASLSAIGSGKLLALANKESLVVGGELVLKALSSTKGRIIPVDSEHSAIFQCLLGERGKNLHKIILTGSGGPFRGKRLTELKNVTVEEALAHPRWKMGRKITIDSATLMNKGLEVIEARYLFEVRYDQIEVVIHPQAIIHSMVEFKDGSIKAHLGQTDMRIPIQYALSYPERMMSPLSYLDLSAIEPLTFEQPDLANFPCLRYAIEAAQDGGTSPAVLNAANEEAVAAFLDRKIKFPRIPEIIFEVLEAHDNREVTDVGVLKEADHWARERAIRLIESEAK